MLFIKKKPNKFKVNMSGKGIHRRKLAFTKRKEKNQIFLQKWLQTRYLNSEETGRQGSPDFTTGFYQNFLLP